LPDEVLLHLLGYTSHQGQAIIAIVDKRFNQLANDPHLALSKFKFSAMKKALINADELEKLIKEKGFHVNA
jgi:hypothetical protein